MGFQPQSLLFVVAVIAVVPGATNAKPSAGTQSSYIIIIIIRAGGNSDDYYLLIV